MQIIMNPPYSNRLEIRILNLAATKASCVVSLQPDFLQPYKALSKAYLAADIDNRIVSVSHLGHEEQFIFGIKHSVDNLMILQLGKDGKTKDSVTFSSDIERSLFYKLLQPREGRVGWRYETFSGPAQTDCDVGCYEWHLGEDEFSTYVGPNTKRHYHFRTPEMANNFVNSLKTNLMKFVCRRIVWPGTPRVTKAFRLEDSYYTQPIDDEFWKNYFSLTEEEIRIIEDNC